MEEVESDSGDEDNEEEGLPSKSKLIKVKQNVLLELVIHDIVTTHSLLYTQMMLDLQYNQLLISNSAVVIATECCYD